MKTAISLPDKLFYIVERYAEKQGLSISELYLTAVSELIERNKKKERKGITRRINEVCDNINTSPNLQIRAASKRILSDSEW